MFSGIQPTGIPHLGNYLGALSHWVSLQTDHESFFCVVDLHAMTMPWDPDDLRRQTVEMGASLLACGVDTQRSVLFVQSHVPAHAELAWILNCVSRMGELRRMVQFKERSRGESESVSVGLFTYPLLQAADVLLYRAGGVPVGEDQRQHLELTRDLAQRFNATFGDVFVVPEPWISSGASRIMALDDPTQKMSKSASRPASSILLTDPPEVIARKVRAAVTDSGRDVRAGDDKPALTNLLTIFSSVAGVDGGDLERRFEGVGYGAFKDELIEALVSRLAPIRERFGDLMADAAQIEEILATGAERAADTAEETLSEARRSIGLMRPAGERRGQAATLR